MTEPDIQSLLRAGIAAAKAAQQEQASQHESTTLSAQAEASRPTNPRKQARQLLLQVLEREPTNIIAWLWLSTAVDNPAHQRACLQKVLEIDPDNKLALAGLARLGQASAPAATGPVKLKPLPSRQSPGIKNQPGTPAARPALAKADQAACPFCQKPISLTAAVCHHCGCPLVVSCPACDERVDVESMACPDCGQTLGNYRQRAAYFAGLAAAYQAHQQPHKALEAWLAVEVLQPDYPHLYLQLGEIQAQLGRTDAAISRLQQAMEHEVDPVPAALALGQIYQQLHHWEEAERLYTQLLAGSPQAAEVHYALGWLLMEQGQAKKAFPYIRKATELAPQHGLAWLRLAQLYEAARDRGKATQAYRRAATLLPADTFKGQSIRQRLEMLQPALPQALAASWSEFTRQMTGPVLVCVLADLLDAGLRPWWIPWTGWLAFFLAVIGTFLVISALSLPHNPLIRLMAGESGLSSSPLRLPAALVGGMFWLLALGLILLPLGQSLPEVPPCPC